RALEGRPGPGQSAEADGPGAAILEYGQVDDGHADAVRQLGERHLPLAEQCVEAYRDRRRLVLAVGRAAVVGMVPHIVAWISASMAAPALTIRAKVSSAAPVRTGIGRCSGTRIRFQNGLGILAMIVSSVSIANR